jgi:hypothetical protein
MAPDHQTTPPSTRRAAPLMAEAHEMIERYIEGCGVTLSLRYCRRHRLIAQPFPA